VLCRYYIPGIRGIELTCFASSALRVSLLLIVLCFSGLVANAQQPVAKPQSPTAQSGDVVRINTELVQTDLMVFDKSGHLVDGLLPEQFEVTVDGKPQTIYFSESVKTGSAQEAAQVATTRPGDRVSPAQGATNTTNKGRVILFFIDDVHLTTQSLGRTRQALMEFVDKRIHDGDQIAIVSTSGQIGFLQQLTDNEAVLHEAIGRLNYKRNPETYAGRTVITDYQANQVAEHNDRALFNYLVSSTINEYQLVPTKGGDPRGLSQLAVNNVRNRVRQINQQAKAVTSDTLDVLLSLMRSSSKLPGRKLLFFVSDGFISDNRGSNAVTMLKQVTQMAARAGIVVYTMEAGGIYSDPAVDAGRNDFPDGMGSGTSARMPSTESSAMREPLRILADDTGGRALVNSNSIPSSILQALDETSAYYLLAWRPDSAAERMSKARLKVVIKNRPDLRVRLRNNYYVPEKPAAQSGQPGTAIADSPAEPAPVKNSPELELLEALGSLYPRHTLPASLSAGYLNSDQGPVLRLSMQIERWAFASDPSADAKKEIDVVGAAIDDRGIIVTFKQLLTVLSNPAAKDQLLPVMWNQQLSLAPGLYQVRVAVRERGTGRMGGAQQWIRVPDLSRGNLQMSSLFVAERKAPSTEQANGPGSLPVNINLRFARSSVLRYQTYLYNVAKGMAPDIEIQERVLQDGKTLITMPARKVPTDPMKDHASVPYWAELSLSTLARGHYRLELTATDRTTKSSAIQTLRFVVE
jgi:VWFA-related protein